MHEQGGYQAEDIEKLEIIAVYEQGTRCLTSATLCTSIDMLSRCHPSQLLSFVGTRSSWKRESESNLVLPHPRSLYCFT